LLIERVKKRVCDVTEADTSGTPVTGHKARRRAAGACPACVFTKREVAASMGQGGAVALRLWYLPLDVVLKRE
jgi:hypothetical protein